MNYICIPPQKRGKLNNKEALKLGCVPKKHFKKLTTGESVTLDDGTVITPDQVMEKSLPSEMFMINFLPDESYVNSLVNNQQYARFYAENISDKNKLALMYHSLESINILKNEQYIEFMNKFGPNVKHIIDCRELNTDRVFKFHLKPFLFR